MGKKNRKNKKRMKKALLAQSSYNVPIIQDEATIAFVAMIDTRPAIISVRYHIGKIPSGEIVHIKPSKININTGVFPYGKLGAWARYLSDEELEKFVLSMLETLVDV